MVSYQNRTWDIKVKAFKKKYIKNDFVFSWLFFEKLTNAKGNRKNPSIVIIKQ